MGPVPAPVAGPGALALMAMVEDFNAVEAEHRQQHGEPDLPTCPASQLRTPTSWSDAHSGEDSDIWYGTEDAEFRGLIDASTFELADAS